MAQHARSTSGARPVARVPVAPAGTDGAPVSRRVLDLLGRSDAEVVAAHLCQDPGERFVHAHLAALRAGAALVERVGRPHGRRAPRTVWDMVAVLRPALAPWSEWFAAAASRRAGIESGRWASVTDAEADEHLAAAERFQDVVRAELGLDPTHDAVTGRLDEVGVRRAS